MAADTSNLRFIAHNTRHLCRLDLPGGGQVTAHGHTLYIAHMEPPFGTSILDISDPRDPKVIGKVELENDHSHSHKVRVADDIMITNAEFWYRGSLAQGRKVRSTQLALEKTLGRPPTDQEIAAELGTTVADVLEMVRLENATGYDEGGFHIWDVSDKANPKHIHFEQTFGKGCHRFDMDENYAYMSTEVEGFVGNILVIYDIGDPAKPQEVSRWWLPGQNVAAGETPTWDGASIRLHHALRFGDTMWAGCWGGGVAAIDVSDIKNPKTIGTDDYHPPFREVSHTFMPVPFEVGGRRVALAIDEEGRHPATGQMHAFMWVIDVGDIANMAPIATYSMDEGDSPHARPAVAAGLRFGAHQFREKMTDTLVYATWFAGGLRIIDVKDPLLPEEVGFFIPAPSPAATMVEGFRSVQSNDVDVDDRGVIYILDRLNGLDVVEYVPHT